MVDVERKYFSISIPLGFIYPVKDQREMTKDAAERYQTLKTILQQLDQPIMQISDQISAIQDKFNRGLCSIFMAQY